MPLSLDDARHLVNHYVEHYNTARLHTAIGYVAPKDKFEGRDKAIHVERDCKLAEARYQHNQQRQSQPQPLRLAPTPPAQPLPAIDFAAVLAPITIAAVLHLLGFQAYCTRSLNNSVLLGEPG